MKIIFLDIDGVLAVRYQRDADGYGSGFHPEFVQSLRRIVEATDAKIVISSTWRSSGLKIMQEMWAARNLPGEVIDVTGMLRFGRYATSHPETIWEAKDIQGSVPRGCEIQHWLSEKGFQRINWCRDTQLEYVNKADVKNYVILDDDSDMLYCQREHFVKTSQQQHLPDAQEGYGLTSEAADRAIQILSSSIEELYYPRC